jgi:hypothetical protein
MAKSMHNFPTGENVRDFIVREASKPGGLVEAGSRPDRQKKDSLFENIVSPEKGAGGKKTLGVLAVSIEMRV